VRELVPRVGPLCLKDDLFGGNSKLPDFGGHNFGDMRAFCRRVGDAAREHDFEFSIHSVELAAASTRS
jgi:hypothetical protein